jgi:endonuclease G
VLLDADALNKATGRTGSFRADPALQKGDRAEPADYAKSGYDIGHMAPANDFKGSVEAMKATFILTPSMASSFSVGSART